MNIIRKFQKKRAEFETKKNVRKAKKLAGLREERKRLEGYAKIDKTYQKEKERIAKARMQSYEAKRKTSRFRNSAFGKSVRKSVISKAEPESNKKDIFSKADKDIFGGRKDIFSKPKR